MASLSESLIDHLIIDERRVLINRILQAHGVADPNCFKVESFDRFGDTMYTFFGSNVPSETYMTYRLSVQTGEDDATIFRFNEQASYIRGAYGPLVERAGRMAPEEGQIYLATTLHQALGNLMLDGSDPVPDDKLD